MTPAWLRRLSGSMDQRPHQTPGHAWCCDCGDCMADGYRSQWLRRYGCPCDLPQMCSPPQIFIHTDPECPTWGQTVVR